MDDSSNKEGGAEGHQTRQSFKQFEIIYVKLNNCKKMPAMVAREKLTDDGMVAISVAMKDGKQKCFKVDPKYIVGSAKVLDLGIPFSDTPCECCQSTGAFYAINAFSLGCTVCKRGFCTEPLINAKDKAWSRAVCCGKKMNLKGLKVWCKKCKAVAPNTFTVSQLKHAKSEYEKHHQCALTLWNMSCKKGTPGGVTKAKYKHCHDLAKIHRPYLNDQSRRIRDTIARVQ